MVSNWMIYGATGYTGIRIAREAAKRGQQPLIAGRSREKVEKLAQELKCPAKVFPIGSPGELARQIAGLDAVVNCAGPFSATAAPMMDACIQAGVSYLDITGEIDVIEAGAKRDAQAAEVKIRLMPAVGFDVVPSDCLAATLADELHGATQLQLAFTASGGFSPGTAKTMVESLPSGGRARIDGQIVRVPSAWKIAEIPFASGRRTAVTIPWGDVASAYYTTGIENIEVYTTMPRSQIKFLRSFRWALPLAGIGFVQSFLKKRVDCQVHGPSDEEYAKSRCSLWGRVTDARGRTVEGTLETPGGYPLTVMTTLAAVDKVINGEVHEGAYGFLTPARAFGKHFIKTFPGVELHLERTASGTHASPTPSSHG
ncbi:MAG: saccharopine dehydrogenase NADP-binding domain-containing protein [Planctomycetaceae bacterium]|nr:saccharopine dehydrogenase NADP-binding domain-containing protein [Planctomycetaceae bacterium]